MYVLLHGTKKNAGDFLIFERALALIKAYRKTNDFLILPRWHPLDAHLEAVNKAEAVIICGGPGYGKDFYPGIYALVDNLERITVPIIPLALGWHGTPIDPKDFHFSEQSLSAIQKIHGRISQSSVRDVLTEDVVKTKAKVENVLMTGCVAWYYLPKVEMDFKPPDMLKKIVVSTPAKLKHFPQAFRLLDVVKKQFPQSELYLVFHRGMKPDQHTRMNHAVANASLAAYGQLRGYKIVNAAYSTDHLNFYEECDLHIGYRVHGHINFLSYRNPSILIQEDGRGVGQTMTLGTKDVVANDPDALNKIENIIQSYRDTNFDAFYPIMQKIRDTHQTMKGFIESF